MDPQPSHDNDIPTKKEFPTESEIVADHRGHLKAARISVGVDIAALMEVSTNALQQSTYPSIRLFFGKSLNKLFLLTFDDGTEVIARFPYPDHFHKDTMLSEVSTMLFARQVVQLPVPRLYAWSIKEGNESPVNAPFILMERLPGVSMDDYDWHRKLDQNKRIAVVKSLAKLHSKIISPLPPTFQKAGALHLRDFPETCLLWDNDNVPLDHFEVAPFPPAMAFRKSIGRDFVVAVNETFPTIAEHWYTAVEEEFMEVKRRCSALTEDQPFVFPAHFIFEDVPQTVEDFVEVYRNLMTLIGYYRRKYSPSHPSQRLCLWNHDYALRNVLFDPETFEVKGIVDWESSSIVPLALSARYPSELEDVELDGDPRPNWKYYSNNITYLYSGDTNPSFEIDTVWYRFFYSGITAEIDVSMGANYWRDSELALKLHELVDDGFLHWLRRKEWLRESVAKINSSSEARTQRR